jgi:hypothetical protein
MIDAVAVCDGQLLERAAALAQRVGDAEHDNDGVRLARHGDACAFGVDRHVVCQKRREQSEQQRQQARKRRDHAGAALQERPKRRPFGDPDEEKADADNDQQEWKRENVRISIDRRHSPPVPSAVFAPRHRAHDAPGRESGRMG